jgi:hypothetical protein
VIPVAESAGLRIDPARGLGKMEVDWIRLGQAGRVVEEWSFGHEK